MGFCRSVAARSLFEVGALAMDSAFLILPLTRDCISSRAKHMLQILDVLQAG